jgi:putative two-component system response regulator
MSIEIKETVLIVDDVPANILILSNILENKYTVKFATNGEKALKIAASKDKPSIILLDVMMPGMDGYEVCRRLKENTITSKIPVIFVTAADHVEDESAGFEVGCVDYITKPISAPLVLARIKTHLHLYDQNLALEEKVKERTNELNDTRLEIIKRLSLASELRDFETGRHVIRMSNYCYQIALEIGLPSEEAELIMQASQMHDVGKLGVPDSILLKPGKLDDSEWKVMMKHTEIGAKILGGHSSKLLSYASNAALSHHEKWNGTGYPNKLEGEGIPLIGRITTIGDIFDALTSQRPYKKAWSTEEAVKYINEEESKTFDPWIVSAFNKRINDIMEIKNQYGDEVLECILK